ncbi:ammonium transporter [Cyanobium sp. Cruz CV13-4-11]|jgi:ammonium transporter, Amt family|uniref:ammonium transporter n=1 Tax=unclassified Cyanobium TaxID=2627006 RepID=UPI0020CE6F1E|nr:MULTISPECIES: ammonium transporter [unclassified Cyanobium]MCP9900966.1 ammonium transporter [Cyanobium sp. Cruz CV11-17]MCP9920113.1 ammonium transporter [Cyanobium sp. Cruz CV13-4-11]
MTLSSTGRGRSAEATFDRFRSLALARLQDPQLRSAAFCLLALGAGIVPLLAGSAKAALAAAPTDGADTLLMLVGSAMVLLMTPGLAFFYGGFTRSKNVLNCMMMSFFLMGLIGVLWVVVGYSLAFDAGFGSPFIGGLGSMFLHGVGGELGDKALAPGFPISATSFALFQGMFAIITPALISGALVERISFKAWFWFCLIWSLLIYSPMAKMVWGGGFIGPFGSIGAIDFAGGTVVHIASGVAALVAAAIIGPRTTWPNSKRPPHNVPFILLGAGLLWFGWFGFNGASMFASKTAGFPFLTTTTSASAGLLTWCLIEWLKDGKPTAVGAATGAVAGLVGITPAAGFVYMEQSILIGILTAVACFVAVRIKAAIQFDDSLDTFMVHGVGGTVGALLTGILASKALVPGDYFPLSAKIMEESGNFGLFIAQLKATLVTYGFVALGTAIILWVLGALMPLRVSAEDEERGLDFVAHGEEAYDPMTN